MTHPKHIVSVLQNMQAFAQENCFSEVALHLGRARRRVEPYLSDQPPAAAPDPEIQTARNVLEDLITFAEAQGMDDVLDDLVAARRKLMNNEPPHIAERVVITFPVRASRIKGSRSK